MARTYFSFLCAMHCYLKKWTAHFKTSNQIYNRYGAPLFSKNALKLDSHFPKKTFLFASMIARQKW